MARSVLRGALVLVASSGLVVAGTASALAGGDHHHRVQTVEVVGHGSAVDVSTDSVRSGSVAFHVSTTNAATAEGGGSEITLFRLNDGVTQEQFFADLQKEFSSDHAEAAEGTRNLTGDATFRGLADVVPDHPEVVTEHLDSGTYYLMDLGTQPENGVPTLTEFTVSGRDDGDHHGRPRSDVSVKTVDERFVVSTTTWPSAGTYSFMNDADTLHFMAIVPVKEGTTDAEIQAFFDSGDQTAVPPFAVEGPTGGNDVVSPGYRLQLSYSLPAGTYVLLCFVADEKTGLPHAVMGMHQVIQLVD